MMNKKQIQGLCNHLEKNSLKKTMKHEIYHILAFFLLLFFSICAISYILPILSFLIFQSLNPQKIIITNVGGSLGFLSGTIVYGYILYRLLKWSYKLFRKTEVMQAASFDMSPSPSATKTSENPRAPPQSPL